MSRFSKVSYNKGFNLRWFKVGENVTHFPTDKLEVRCVYKRVDGCYEISFVGKQTRYPYHLTLSREYYLHSIKHNKLYRFYFSNERAEFNE